MAAPNEICQRSGNSLPTLCPPKNSFAIKGNRGDGSVEVTESKGIYFVTGNFQNTDIKFVVDTGAGAVILRKSDAVKAGINLKKLNFNTRGDTANGATTRAYFALDRLVVGNCTLHMVIASVQKEADPEFSLLGTSGLKKMQVSLGPNGMKIKCADGPS